MGQIRWNPISYPKSQRSALCDNTVFWFTVCVCVNPLFQSNGADQFAINNKNLFQEDGQSASPDVPPALPPKTGTPTRPPPPPPGECFTLHIISTGGKSVIVRPVCIHLPVCASPVQVRNRPSPEQSRPSHSIDEDTSSRSFQETSPPLPPRLPCLPRIP